MNGDLVTNSALLQAVRAGAQAQSAELAVCVPAPYLAQTQAALEGSLVAWGAQDMSAHEAGAYTGEVAGRMLKDFACRYVILGHSERRSMHGESSADVAKKTKQALAHGLTPIVCVGETLAEREAGSTAHIVQEQLQPVLSEVHDQLKHIVIAYEPVWAIGTGKTATPEMAQEVHALIRQQLAAADSADLAVGGIEGDHIGRRGRAFPICIHRPSVEFIAVILDEDLGGRRRAAVVADFTP
jgi:triosephosphate isomerase